MAKQIKRIQIVIEVPYVGGVRDDNGIVATQVNYTIEDSVDAELVKHAGLHLAEGVPITLPAADLGALGTQGTILYRINACEADVLTKEGIV